MIRIVKLIKLLATLILIIALSITTLLIYPLSKPLSQKTTESPLLITNINIVDIQNNAIIKNQSIYIEGNRIKNIGVKDSINYDKNTIEINGINKYVIPGLWDMHSHLGFQTAPLYSMPMNIAAGVTNIRDMQGIVNINNERVQWQKQIENGELLGPRIIGYADQIVGNNYDEKDVIEVVNKSLKNKNTFIKIYSQILSERYFKLAEEAKKKGVVFAGHYPNAINPIDASNAGQKSFEHAILFFAHCYPDADKLRESYRAYYAYEGDFSRSIDDRLKMLEEFDYNKFDELVSVMIANDTYYCPTHITRKTEAFAGNEDFRDDPRLKYIPFFMNFIWQDDLDGSATWNGDKGQKYLKDIYQKGLELTKQSHDKGLKILAGSDSGDPLSFPGFAIHDEIEDFVRAGLSPADALATATINPAEYFEMTKDYGSIEEGKIADIIMLNRNPLKDISSIRDIHSVIFNGNVYNRKELDSFLNYVENNTSGFSGLALSMKMFGRLFTDNRN